MAFTGVDKNIPVYVPDNSNSQYQCANFCHEFTNYVGGTGNGGGDARREGCYRKPAYPKGGGNEIAFVFYLRLHEFVQLCERNCVAW